MENNKQELNEQESLLLIAGMISKAQNHFQERGFLYIMWGWFIFFCSIIHFILLHWHLIAHPERLWALTWLLTIYQVFYIVKKRKTERVKTYTGEIIAYLWMVFVVCSLLCVFLVSRFGNMLMLYPLFFMLYGIPTFLSGVIMKFTPLKLGAAACWVLSIVASFTNQECQLLLLSVAMVVAWIIPGHLMQARFKASIK